MVRTMDSNLMYLIKQVRFFCQAGNIRIYLDRPMTPFEGKGMLIF